MRSVPTYYHVGSMSVLKNVILGSVALVRYWFLRLVIAARSTRKYLAISETMFWSPTTTVNYKTEYKHPLNPGSKARSLVKLFVRESLTAVNMLARKAAIHTTKNLPTAQCHRMS